MSDLIIETRAGKVRGKKQISVYGIEFCSFKGISYAKPPTRELRFSDPQPLEPWIGIREVTKHGSNCARKDYFSNEIVGSDDCLYLNVYTRQVVPKQKWPVMVWIHGGGFFDGSGDESLYGPDLFMRKDVIVVTLNYRLGVLGFLNLNHQLATGNQGLKDQVMALKWVKDNIENFGGDPNNVTIFGQSAGSASVHYLCLSSTARGLFHKAILQSGVILNPWAYRSNSKDKIYRLCEHLGHTKKDPESIVKFLKTIEVHRLIDAQEKIVTKEEHSQFEVPFGPTIDSRSKTPLLPLHPEEAAAKGIEVPILIGYNSREGICFLKEFSEYIKHSTPEIEKILPATVKDTLKKCYNLTCEDLMQIYFNNKPLTKESLEKVADFLGDLYFIEGIQRIIKTQMVEKKNSTYVYQFTYDKEPSVFKLIGNVQMSGVCHEDELKFLFKRSLSDGKFELPKEGSTAAKISEQMIEFWVNFATTGNPTPKLSELLPVKWQPIDEKSGIRYLNICENLRMEVAPDIAQQYAARKYPKHVA